MTENSDGAFIEFKNVSKNYKNIRALENISFMVEKGDIFGYIGPNGSGKTTTIKIIVGLIQDFEGEVLIRSKRVRKIRKDIHKILGYLPQEAGFQRWRTVSGILNTFGMLSGLPRNTLKKRIQDILELVGLEDVKNKKITHLSGGMVQKLRLAQALLHKPELLILDEPLSGLDPTSRYQVKKIIKELADEGKTIFLSSHILSDVQNIATRIGILNHGKIMKVGRPKDLQRDFKVGNDLEIIFSEGSKQCNDLDKVPGVESIEIINTNKLIAHLSPNSNIDECINTILAKILEQKCYIRNFNLLEPSLEEVYLKYVGGNIK